VNTFTQPDIFQIRATF